MSHHQSYNQLLSTIKAIPPPLLPPGKSYDPNLTAKIAALQLHPTLEATLHILNHDLPSAHFLVRHMQSVPAIEGMLLHAILHRIEGDYDNARAWYGDVARDGEGGKLLDEAWNVERGEGKDRVLGFVEEVERLKKEEKGDQEALREKSRGEIESVLRWSERKFGTGKWENASSAWVRPSEKIQEMGRDQVSEGKGRRDF